MNEQTTTKPRPQVVTWAPSQTGPCARCHAPTCRYGVGGSPLCTPCRQARQEQPARP
ncbi:hypothetical protein [Streptomyces sp. NRRL S-237]|uniref:hypothetical protein n=1 Tax=Streptomyces sp. NRRL S-237 TaxID=1463895 RepID=UPI00131ECA96|nr:hypothetical protein [Streptomyces sp. NRRL S-237]